MMKFSGFTPASSHLAFTCWAIWSSFRIRLPASEIWSFTDLVAEQQGLPSRSRPRSANMSTQSSWVNAGSRVATFSGGKSKVAAGVACSMVAEGHTLFTMPSGGGNPRTYIYHFTLCSPSVMRRVST